MVNSYIIKRKDLKKVSRWMKDQSFFDDVMPKSSNFYETFIGEYPNSIAFDDSRGDFNIWTKINRGNKKLEVPIVVTDDSYLNEFTLDCSSGGSISLKIPSKLLVNEMNLCHKYLDGRFYNNKKLVSIDTSVFEENFPSALLIDKQSILEYLNKNDYVIFWTLLGQKQLIGGNYSGKEFVGRLERN